MITGNIISIGILSPGDFEGSTEVDVSNCKKVAFLVKAIFGDWEGGCVNTESVYFDVWVSTPDADTTSTELGYFYRHKRYELIPRDWVSGTGMGIVAYCNISPIIDVEPFSKLRVSLCSERTDVDIRVRMHKVEEGI